MSAFGHRLHTCLLFLAISFLILVSTPAHAQRGALTEPRNLGDLTLAADRILQGHVEAVHVEAYPTYPNLRVLVITLAPDEVLKGPTEKQVTLRQFIWDIRDIAENAGYRTGDEVLLFLNRPTSLGLVSPVGLEQGRFRILHLSSEQSVAVNGAGNRHLMEGLAASGKLRPQELSPATRATVQSFQGGPISLSALKEMVKSLLAQSGKAR